MEIHESARRHGVGDEHPVVVVDLDPDSDPPKILVVGPDRAGNMLEVIVLLLAENEQLASHAMPLRRTYHQLLEGTSDE